MISNFISATLLYLNEKLKILKVTEHNNSKIVDPFDSDGCVLCRCTLFKEGYHMLEKNRSRAIENSWKNSNVGRYPFHIVPM